MTVSNSIAAGSATTASPPPPRTTIAFSAIVVIAANTMNGPGLTTLPAVGANAGLLMFVILTTLSMSVTSFVIYCLCKLIWTHQKLDHQVEGPALDESDIVALSGEAFKSMSTTTTTDHQRSSSSSSSSSSRRVVSIAMVGCALALALAQMMLCAKIADAMIVASFGKACGISPIPTTNQILHCTSNLSMKPFTTTTTSSSPTTTQQQLHDTTPIIGFETTTTTTTKDTIPTSSSSSPPPPPMFLITLGLLISSSITISLASVDQSSMITAQYILFGCLLLACIRFCYTLSNERCSTNVDFDFDYEENNNGIDNNNSQQKQQQQQQQVDWFLGKHPFEAVGSILFNFAFVVTAPPLACDAHSMNEAIHALIVAITTMGLLYVIIGWIGAPAAAACSSIADGNNNVAGGGGDDTNLLSLVLRGRNHWDILGVIVFGLSQLAAIPVYCELARETLDAHMKVHFPSPKTNFWLCHAVPWMICAITYNSELFESFVEWSSLLLLGFANFSLPLLLDLMLRGHHGDVVKMPPLMGGHTITIGRFFGCRGDLVLWMYSFVSGGIASVIIQRMTNSIMLAEIGFVATILLILHYNNQTQHQHRSTPTLSKRSSDIISPSGGSGIDLHHNLVHHQGDDNVSSPLSSPRLHKKVHNEPVGHHIDDDQLVPFL